MSPLYRININMLWLLKTKQNKNRKEVEIKCPQFIFLIETGAYVTQTGLHLGIRTAEYAPLNLGSTSRVSRLQAHTAMSDLCNAGGRTRALCMLGKQTLHWVAASAHIHFFPTIIFEYVIYWRLFPEDIPAGRSSGNFTNVSI